MKERCCFPGNAGPSPSAQLQPETNRQDQYSPILPPNSVRHHAQGSLFHPAIRPPMHSQGPSPSTFIPLPSHQGPPAPLSRPSISTPIQQPATSVPNMTGIRRHPSELSRAERAILDAEIKAQEAKHEANVADIKRTYQDNPVELQKKLYSAKTGNDTKMSGIRRKHGVSLRMSKADRQRREEAGVPSPTYTYKACPQHAPTDMSPPTSSFSPVNGSGNKRRRSQEDDHGSPRPQPWFTNPSTRNVSTPKHSSSVIVLTDTESENEG